MSHIEEDLERESKPPSFYQRCVARVCEPKNEQELNVKETKPPIINQQCVVYGFQCDLCDACYVGYTRGHLLNSVKDDKQQSSVIAKHYKSVHRTMPKKCSRNAETSLTF